VLAVEPPAWLRPGLKEERNEMNIINHQCNCLNEFTEKNEVVEFKN
jgi:hypothetical protein